MPKSPEWIYHRHAHFYDLIQLTEHTWSVVIGRAFAHTRILIHMLPGKKAVLCDSAAFYCPQLFSWLEEQGVSVRAVICTHMHWDHVSNNYEVHDRYRGQIFASSTEWNTALTGMRPTEYPITFFEDNADIDIDGAIFHTRILPGHSAGHHAIITPDGICYLGDAIMSLGPLQEAKLPYMEDIELSVKSMEEIAEMDYPLFVCSHNAVIRPDELPALVEANIQAELELYRKIREFIREPGDLEEYVVSFMKSLGVSAETYTDEVWKHTARRRILELVHAGELILDGSVVKPLSLSSYFI